MRYWNEMLSKYGFQDGESVPRDAKKQRAVYVEAVNERAQVNGSRFKVEPFDRPGVHNWCLITFAPEGELDHEMHEAIEAAHEAID